jgi:hypothetical protein
LTPKTHRLKIVMIEHRAGKCFITTQCGKTRYGPVEGANYYEALGKIAAMSLSFAAESVTLSYGDNYVRGTHP